MSSETNCKFTNDGTPFPLPRNRKSGSAVPTGAEQNRIIYSSAAAGLFASGVVPPNPLLPVGIQVGIGSHMQPLALVNQGHLQGNQVVGTLQNTTTPVAAVNLFPASQATKAKAGSPDFFRGWKLRFGKWLEEEEAYAELLIEMFDKGELEDCMVGSTLRAYLAQKLHCAPMRISKKFAGKGIGKKVFSSRTEPRTCVSKPELGPRSKLREQVEKVEKKFHEAAATDAVSRTKYVSPILHLFWLPILIWLIFFFLHSRKSTQHQTCFRDFILSWQQHMGYHLQYLSWQPNNIISLICRMGAFWMYIRQQDYSPISTDFSRCHRVQRVLVRQLQPNA